MLKVYDRIIDMRGSLITVQATNVALGELALIYKSDGTTTLGSVLKFDGDLVTLQVFENVRGISTGDKVSFLNRPMQVTFSDSLLGRCLSGTGAPIDGGPEIIGEKININTPSFNPTKRIIPRDIIRTNIPMIDVFNCLVKSQKIPIFSIAGEPYNQLLMRIANQTDADIVIIGGMGLRFDDYQAFINNAQSSASIDKTVLFIHLATDPAVECILVPDMALAAAEKFATEGNNVLVLLTDMTAFADSIKEISITMDQIPSNRGYPGSLYSDLASRYEKAVDIEGSGSITIVSVTTMPGGDVTHPIPDNTGYITEGQFYLHNAMIDPFGSLSRLKQNVIGKVTREDHQDLANTLIRLYADSKKAKERQSMGFKLSHWDEKLLKYSNLFVSRMMNLDVNITLEGALDEGWTMLAECFNKEEVSMKRNIVEKYWPREKSYD
ncbi:MAG: V-type sodium ATPase subunit B [Candidatus Anoxychlamydiales bacterium]|nr:V-type sodium ATPase subunit B [Candidatus Anoxychlamydiales bacterium]NGX36369.1 V-type sodium ATPase subunit B [Candidatus Anoxychlamydiales bacterium]